MPLYIHTRDRPAPDPPDTRTPEQRALALFRERAEARERRRRAAEGPPLTKDQLCRILAAEARAMAARRG